MINQDAVMATLAAANPVPRPMPHGPDERAEAERVLDRVLNSSRPARRRDRAGRTWLADALMIVGALCVVAVVAIVFVDVGHGRQQGRTSVTPAIGHGVPSALAAAFAVLRRPRQPRDELPPRVASTFRGSRYGVKPEFSRLAGRPDGSPVWLIPGTYGSCLYDGASSDAQTTNGARVVAGPSVCGPDALVEKHGLILMLIPAGAPSRETRSIFVGVMPDGTTLTAKNPDGRRPRIARSGSAFRIIGALTVTIRTEAASKRTIRPS